MASTLPQMFDHFLEPLKGWFEGVALEYVAALSSNVTFDVPAGRVASLNSSGEFEMGCTGHNMPVFLFRSSADFDVAKISDGPHGIFTVGPQNIKGLVGSGGFE